MRKTLSLVLAVLMVLALLPAMKLNSAVAEETAKTYTLVTSEDDLTAGDSYLIAGITDDGDGYVLSKDRGSNRLAYQVEITEGATISLTSAQIAAKADDELAFDNMDEFNCAMDAGPIGQGLPATSYKMTPGDLFQFHEDPKPWIATNPTLGTSWLCAMDDMNRYEDQVTQALFYVEEVEYNDPNRALYMTKLSLKCIWKETDDTKFASYTVGQTYTAVKSI